MAVARLALEGIGRVIGAMPHPNATTLEVMRKNLLQYAEHLPTVHRGLHAIALDLGDNLGDEARSYLDDRRKGLGILPPWRAVASWSLSRDENLWQLLQQAADAETVEVRRRIKVRILEQKELVTNPMVKAQVPDNWIEAALGADFVDLLFQAVLFAIDLEKEYSVTGKYPVKSIRVPQVSASGLQYEPTEDLTAYRIAISGSAVVQRLPASPRGSASSQPR
jgi:hypothetical protein